MAPADQSLRHLLEAKGPTREMVDVINRHLAEKGLMMREGTVVNATLIAAPPSTKNKDGKRDPEMRASLIHIQEGIQVHYQKIRWSPVQHAVFRQIEKLVMMSLMAKSTIRKHSEYH